MPILRIEDPIITELRIIVETRLARKCSFVYADLFEANYGLGELKNVDFPVFLYFATDKNKYKINAVGMQVRTAPIVGMMLTQRMDTTADYKSAEVNPDIHLCRQLVENLVFNCNNSLITSKGDEIKDFSADSIYGKFDGHLFGVATSFEWTTLGGTGCYK
jgi:hypothetical protein